MDNLKITLQIPVLTMNIVPFTRTLGTGSLYKLKTKRIVLDNFFMRIAKFFIANSHLAPYV